MRGETEVMMARLFAANWWTAYGHESLARRAVEFARTKGVLSLYRGYREERELDNFVAACLEQFEVEPDAAQIAFMVFRELDPYIDAAGDSSTPEGTIEGAIGRADILKMRPSEWRM